MRFKFGLKEQASEALDILQSAFWDLFYISTQECNCSIILFEYQSKVGK